MKRLIILAFLQLLLFKTFAQQDKDIALEWDVNYYNYFEHEKMNYGYSFLVSKYIHSIKLSSGINYRTFNHSNSFAPEYTTNFTKKIDYNADYFCIPITINKNIFTHKTFSASVLFGVSFNRLLNYKITTHYLYIPKETKTIEIKNNANSETATIIGFTVSKTIGKHFKINLGSSANYLIYSENKSQRPDDAPLMPYQQLSVGNKLGLEYVFLKNNTNN